MSKVGLSKSEIANNLDELSKFLDDAIDRAMEDESSAAVSNLSYAKGVVDAIISNI